MCIYRWRRRAGNRRCRGKTCGATARRERRGGRRIMDRPAGPYHTTVGEYIFERPLTCDIWRIILCHMTSLSTSPPRLRVCISHNWEETRHLSAKSNWFVFSPTENPSQRWLAVYANLVAKKTLLRHLSEENVATIIGGLQSGLPISSVDRVVAVMGITRATLSALIHVSPRTLSRRETLNVPESERLFRISALFQRALEVLGESQEARNWFTEPKKALGGHSPLEYADTEIGAREVEDLLGRIEHGVFS